MFRDRGQQLQRSVASTVERCIRRVTSWLVGFQRYGNGGGIMDGLSVIGDSHCDLRVSAAFACSCGLGYTPGRNQRENWFAPSVTAEVNTQSQLSPSPPESPTTLPFALSLPLRFVINSLRTVLTTSRHPLESDVVWNCWTINESFSDKLLARSRFTQCRPDAPPVERSVSLQREHSPNGRTSKEAPATALINLLQWRH